jgi:Uma2 family endonuclease
MAMAATIPYYTVEDLAHFPNDGNRYELLDGVLLVTPPPSVGHELVLSRIHQIIVIAVQLPGHAQVFTHGAIQLLPKTQLEPDLLVVPPNTSSNSKWHEIAGHWLAVEVLSRSSKIYDREFKRDAYLTLGVREVWLVDRDDRSVDVTRTRGEIETVRDTIVWHPPTLDLEVRVDLNDIFAGID